MESSSLKDFRLQTVSPKLIAGTNIRYEKHSVQDIGINESGILSATNEMPDLRKIQGGEAWFLVTSKQVVLEPRKPTQLILEQHLHTPPGCFQGFLLLDHDMDFGYGPVNLSDYWTGLLEVYTKRNCARAIEPGTALIYTFFVPPTLPYIHVVTDDSVDQTELPVQE